MFFLNFLIKHHNLLQFKYNHNFNNNFIIHHQINFSLQIIRLTFLKQVPLILLIQYHANLFFRYLLFEDLHKVALSLFTSPDFI